MVPPARRRRRVRISRDERGVLRRPPFTFRCRSDARFRGHGPADAVRALPLPRRQAHAGRLRPRPVRQPIPTVTAAVDRVLASETVHRVLAPHARRGPQPRLPPAPIDRDRADSRAVSRHGQPAACVPALLGQRLAEALALRLERDVGEHRLARAATPGRRAGRRGRPTTCSRRRSSSHGDGERLVEPVHPQHEHPERVALSSTEAATRRSRRSRSSFESSASRCSGSVIVATSTTSAQPAHRDRLADGRRVARSTQCA